LRVGEDDLIASSQPLERTSSRIPTFFFGIVKDGPCRKVEVAVGEHDRLEDVPAPSLDLVLVKVAVSPRRV
jgi:hypothetical protein